MSKQCTLEIAPMENGYLFRAIGRGTMRESPAVRDFISGAMEDGARVVLDLNQCEFLDSTFLGCLVILQRRGNADSHQFQVYADTPTRDALFQTCHLEQVLSFATSLPATSGDPIELHAANLGRSEFSGHLLETHRELAKLGGPAATTFQRIADQIASELKGKP